MSISLAFSTAPRPVPATASLRPVLVTALRYGLQLGILWVVFTAGSLLSSTLRLPLPGNLTGMLLLLAALWSGVLPSEWVADLAGLLVTTSRRNAASCRRASSTR